MRDAERSNPGVLMSLESFKSFFGYQEFSLRSLKLSKRSTAQTLPFLGKLVRIKVLDFPGSAMLKVPNVFPVKLTKWLAFRHNLSLMILRRIVIGHP
jgi:hypothetical protein